MGELEGVGEHEARLLTIPDNPVVTKRYDPEQDNPPAEAVVEAVAQATDSDPFELPHLYDAVDPDIICKVLDSSMTGTNPNHGVVFEYHQSIVLVQENGVIAVFMG